jgi:hypothetical protein
LKSKGLDSITPESLPEEFCHLAKLFLDEDWDFVKKSPTQLLAIYTVINAYRLKSFDERLGYPIHGGTPRQIAELSTLPLVYCTKFATLKRIIDSGKILSDRAYYNTLIQEGKDPDKFSDYESFHTNTYGDDRRAGLDNFVFTFFGRPPEGTGAYGDIQILLRPNRFYSDPRAFATKDDFANLEIYQEKEDYYRDQVFQGVGNYFLRMAATKLNSSLSHNRRRNYDIDGFLNGNTDGHDQYGRLTFSTWEVKVPEFTIDDIEALVFDSHEQLKNFRAQYGNRFKIIFKPGVVDLRSILSHEFGISDERLNRLNHQQLLSHVFDFFEKRPEKKQEYFGDTEIQHRPSIIYRIPFNETEFDERMITELESGSTARVKSIDEMPPENTRICYAQVDYPKKYITTGSNLYLLNPMQQFYSDLEDARSAQKEMRIRRERAEFSDEGPLRPAIPTRDPVKIEQLHQEREAERVERMKCKMMLVKLKVPIDEYKAYEESPNKWQRTQAILKKYKIEDVVELELLDGNEA